MDKDPEEYASHIQRYADKYLQRREELCAVISEHNRRIERIFLFDRCMSGGILLASLVVICSVALGSRMMGIFGGLAVICMSIAPIVVGIHHILDVASAKKRELEHDLEILDSAWRHWSTS